MQNCHLIAGLHLLLHDRQIDLSWFGNSDECRRPGQSYMWWRSKADIAPENLHDIIAFFVCCVMVPMTQWCLVVNRKIMCNNNCLKKYSLVAKSGLLKTCYYL